MTDNLPEENRAKRDYYDEEEISLLDYWRVIWKRKIFITLLVFFTVLATAVSAIRQIDIYRATAVITPIGPEGSGSGSLSILSQQFGGIPGISLPASASTTEIVNLLNSNMLREKMVDKYNLLSVLFYESWDEEKGEWKKGEEGGFSLNPSRWIVGVLRGILNGKKAAAVNAPSMNDGNDGAPSMWDGIRTLQDIIAVNNDVKNNTITVSVDYYDPEMAAKMVEYLLATLTEHMSSEAKKGANTKRSYLEGQLRSTADPLIRQKIYTLISQQIEAAMMSELKEEFAFRVIDPPKAPDRRIKPKRSTMVMMGFFISLFAGVFLAFFLEYIKNARSKGA